MSMSSTSWEHYKRESDKTLWVHICGNGKSQIAMAVNKWWYTRYPTYKMRIVNKESLEALKKEGLIFQNNQYYFCLVNGDNGLYR